MRFWPTATCLLWVKLVKHSPASRTYPIVLGELVDKSANVNLIRRPFCGTSVCCRSDINLVNVALIRYPTIFPWTLDSNFRPYFTILLELMISNPNFVILRCTRHGFCWPQIHNHRFLNHGHPCGPMLHHLCG